MRGDPEVIEHLNEVLSSELTAINQYFVHFKLCANQGYAGLAKKKREESLEEMRHADRVIDRILFLEGVPNMQRLFPVRVGENPLEMNEVDLTLEQEAVARLRAGIQLCLANGDAGTRELLESVLADEEGAIDWLETQASLAKDLGREHYLAQLVRE